jgi:hypothetical protein
MRLSRAHRERRSSQAHDGARIRTIQLASAQGTEVVPTRDEPRAFGARPASVDPYALWIAKREAERERPEVRWVYRYPRVTREASIGDGAGAPA